jgi:multidrug efflux pump
MSVEALRMQGEGRSDARPLAWWIGPAVTLLAAALAFAWTLHAELQRLYGMTGSAWDFAYDQQVIWNVSAGQGFYTSFARANFLGIHFELIFVVLAAVEKLWPHPAVLLIFSSASLALTAPAAYLFFRAMLPADRAESSWLAIALALPIPFWAAIQEAARDFFHPENMALAFALLAVMIWGLVHLFLTTPTSFVPNEDQGYAFAAIIMPQAASLSRTQEIADKADAIFKGLPGVQTRTVVTGYSLLDSGFKTNASTVFVTFSDFDKRYENVDTAKKENARAILQGFFAKARQIPGAIVIPIAPPAIPVIGTTGGFEFWIQDTGLGDPVALDGVMQDFLKKARERPELTGLATTYSASTQQLRASVDREKTQLLGIPIQDVYSAIQAQFGSLTVSQYNLFSNVWWVIVQSDAPYRQHPEDLTRLYTRNNQNQMVPLSSVVTTTWTQGPDLLPHFNGFTAAKVNGSAAPGYSSGDAIGAMESVAKEALPSGYTFAWSGLAFEEKKSGGTSAIAFVFGLIIVFLVLSAQYESWTLPGAVMTAVPFGILGALVTNWARGLENDVYFQIGLLVLIGLGAKNAVLRVSAAVEFRKEGKSIMEATVLAGEQRLRPIIMTSLAFAIGCLPLAIAVGAGANARHSIGTGIIGGMIGETTLAMLYVPLFFYLFDQLAERRGKKAQMPPSAPAASGGATSVPPAKQEGD